MAVSEKYQIPHSEFLSWEQSDRDKAIWWHIRSKESCPNCGTRRDEWNADKGGHPEAYVASARRCQGCQRIAAKQEELPDNIGAGVQVVLKPNPELEA